MKKIKYLEIKESLNFLNKNQKNILVIVHVNYMTIFESIKLKKLYLTHNIEINTVKGLGLRKLFRNNLFASLFHGPTKILSFSTIDNLFNFFSNVQIKTKIIPLVILWNSIFWNYFYFFSYITEYKKRIENLTILNKNSQTNFLIISFNSTLKNFIYFLGFNYINIYRNLTKIKKY